MITEKQREQIRKNKALLQWFGEDSIERIATREEEELWETEQALRVVTSIEFWEAKKRAATALYSILVGALEE